MIAGERVAVPHPDTIADGLRAPKPGELTFPIVKSFVERVLFHKLPPEIRSVGVVLSGGNVDFEDLAKY
jgi:threonine dehydratase